MPGLLRARLEVDEVVSTLMLNFVAINLTAFLVNHVFLAPGAGNSQTPLIAEAGWLPRLLPPATLNLGFVIALAAPGGLRPVGALHGRSASRHG